MKLYSQPSAVSPAVPRNADDMTKSVITPGYSSPGSCWTQEQRAHLPQQLVPPSFKQKAWHEGDGHRRLLVETVPITPIHGTPSNKAKDDEILFPLYPCYFSSLTSCFIPLENLEAKFQNM